MQSVNVEIEGVTYTGTYRVVAGSVIVYFGSEVKFAPCGMDRSEVVARWLLRDLCFKVEVHHKHTKP
ncbi:hypothetical protein EVC45_42160 [Paraburkholderia sp. UYCP14C]|nr:hypothetical protein EVC45_42160 [Paraburkholderia sp. UYCP14C]